MMFRPLTVRDSVAFILIACDVVSARVAKVGTPATRDLVSQAYAIADEFIDQSEGQWADSARRDRKRKRNGNGS